MEFLAQGDAVVIRPANGQKATPFERWIERAQGSATGGLSTDEIMAITRGED